MNGDLLSRLVPVLILSAGFASAQPFTQEVDLPAAGRAAWGLEADLSVVPGAYVQGSIAADGPVTLHLTDEAGTPVRRLLDRAQGGQEFRFVAGAPMARLVLENTDSVETHAKLRLDRIVPTAEQTGMPKRYLSPRIAGLAAGGDIAAFWAQIAREGAPMIEPGTRPDTVIATFLWRGALHNVRLWGAPASDHVWLERLGGSDLWFASFEIPQDTRLSYALAPDVPQFDAGAGENRRALLATVQADPLNPYTEPVDAPDQWARRSLLELPDAPEQPGMTGADPARRGQVEALAYRSAVLGNSRDVNLYVPAGFDPEDSDTVLLILFDGPQYQREEAPLPRIFDRLIASGRLPPVVVAFVDPIDPEHRAAELPPNANFAAAMAQELKPLVEARLARDFVPERTAVAGSSYGGLAAAWLGLTQPAAFGNVIALSGSFWWGPEGWSGDEMPFMSAEWAQGGNRDVRFWISAGQFEDGDERSILDTSRHLRDVLRLSGQRQVFWRNYSGGHDYAVWRGALADAMIALFGR
ncbi:enterochelin esterase [Paenirhodobacter populi]|uniref:Enterochelin esterase n=1 Tax=Paenirhodobacter populi TaxID=2306993 RepID=A0A443JAC3_9RHOB|nr:enterochelin esterase [Sinirhodobacter populi]RWR17456.1 enterochelin esterase [Sinirhodobacter populi]